MKLKITLFLVLFSLLFSCSESNIEDIVKPKYSITYLGNGNTAGNIPIDNTMYEIDETIIVATNYNSLTRDNYSFVGWNTQQDGFGEVFLESETIRMGDSNIVLFAQWENSIVYHELTTENELKITGLPAIGENEWYYATVSFINGNLILNTEADESYFQFHYASGGDNFGFLRISQNFNFNTAVEVIDNNSRIKTLELGDSINDTVFESYSTAEISGNFQNWSSIENVHVPVRLTIDEEIHFGFLKVSFKDVEGILTIHTIAYNKTANNSIIVF